METEVVKNFVERYDENTALKIQEVVEHFRDLNEWEEKGGSVYAEEVEDPPENQEILYSFSSEEGHRRFEIYDSSGQYEPWVWFANELTGVSGNDPVLSFDPKMVRRKLTKRDKESEWYKRRHMKLDPQSKDPKDISELNLKVSDGILV